MLIDTCNYFVQSAGASDEAKRKQMEQLVREELDRWDSDAPAGARPKSGARGKPKAK